MSGLIELPADSSPAEEWAAKSPEDRRERFAALPRDLRRRLLWNWRWWARPSQLAPIGDWRTWMVMAGRGFGKTRAGAEWVREQVATDPRLRVALVATTLAEARAVMVEGESGLLSIAPPDQRPRYEASLRRLTWANGAQAFLYSAAEADALRGPQHHLAWADEVGKWRDGRAVWDMLAMGLRLGHRPRTVVTTTPRATPLVRFLAEGARGVVTTRGRTVDNRSGLAADFLAHMAETYGGTAFGRQELEGELLLAIEGALWSRPLLEQVRVAHAPPRESWRRVVVGVDPPAGVGAGHDACGIVVVALVDDGRAFVLADASVEGAAPEGWARAVAEATGAWGADRVVAEANNGGAMVASVLRAAEGTLPVQLVHAAHGKVARAEPVATLYAAGRVFHAGSFPALEDELAGLVLGGGYEGPGRSPDRADALVWAVTELLLGRRLAEPGIRTLEPAGGDGPAGAVRVVGPRLLPG